MKRCLVVVLAVVSMLAVALLAPQKQEGKLLVLEWAGKAKGETPPTAVLLEFGLTDKEPTPWSGGVAVKGAKVVHREGYRFRKNDKLNEDRWEASSHRAIKAPARSPQISKMEKIATVGVVLHLSDIKADAALTLRRANKESPEVTVALKDVLAGKPHKVWDGAGVVRLITTATPVVTAQKTENDFPAACYSADGTLWLAYIAYTIKDQDRRNEKEMIKEQPKDFKDYYKPEFGDQLFVKYYRNGKWSEPVAVTGEKEDLARCAIVVDKEDKVHVYYSANRQGEFRLYQRTANVPKDGDELRFDKEQTTYGLLMRMMWYGGQAPNTSVGIVEHEINTSVAQGWRLKATEASKPGTQVKDPPPMARVDVADGHPYLWNRVAAHGPHGLEAGAWDTYQNGDYDIHVTIGDWGSAKPKAAPKSSTLDIASSRFEARPSIAFDPAGRLWIAYEEGPVNWGKDSGALVLDKGNPLYNERSVRVLCYQDGKLFRPTAELPTSMFKNPGAQFDPNVVHRFETSKRYAYPKIGIDGKGRVWLTYRESFSSRYSSIPGSYWITMARRLDGDHWSEPIEVHHSDGLLDSRPVVLPHKSGGVVIFHNTDGRYSTAETIHNQVYMSYVDLPGDPVDPKLVPHEVEKKDAALVKAADEEREAVARIRKYRVKHEGKEYRLLRGEFHRHTELSWDGGADGSLEDMYRYAIDAADLDWVGPTDHDSGAGREYSWWLTQKSCDAYHAPDRFTPIFAYERSVSYPHGHRNCLFAKRGVMTLPRLAEPDANKRVGGVHADDAKMFYRYLHELDGICASHTCATGMGTDWRDNDPKVEPIVEIYQGDRNSYEYEEAPRAGHDPKSGKKPASLGGWHPDGFIDLAFKKGYRFGFQSSSDHWSTHISFCVVLSEKNDRASIINALRQRRCYAATDDIIADVKSGTHLMGEEFKTDAAPSLKIAIAGTKPLAAIHILRDSAVIATIKPGKSDYQGEWTDPTPEAGVHYYYVRVEQADGQLAWTSPMWIDFAKK